MLQKILESAVAEWKYASGLTLKSIESIPTEHWNFSPHAHFGPFSKQIRHVICCRGVFSDAFRSGKLDFSKKHSFYSGSLECDELLAALGESTVKTEETLIQLEAADLSQYKADYYGESLGFIEHFSALVCHEATHRGSWSVYAALGGFYDKKKF
jgi:hypothetical protein